MRLNETNRETKDWKTTTPGTDKKKQKETIHLPKRKDGEKRCFTRVYVEDW